MTSLIDKLSRAALAALLLAGAAGAAHAAGTASGTSIPNSATLNYTVGGTPQASVCSGQTANNTSTCSPTTFVVDTKIDVLVTLQNSTAPVNFTPGASAQLTFTVKNQGNSTQDLALSVLNTVASSQTLVLGGTTYTDSFDPSTCSAADQGTPGTPITSYSGVAADVTKTVLVTCNFPTTKTGVTPFTTSDVALVALKATVQGSGGTTLTQSGTNNQNGTADILFADVAGSDDSARDAAHSARGAYKANPALLSVSKTVTTICDPINGDNTGAQPPMNIPGALVRYTITVTNAAGGSSSTLTTVSDNLNSGNLTPAPLAFDNNFVTGANSASPKTTSCSSAGAPTSGTAGQGVRYRVTNSTRASNNTYTYGTSSAVLSGNTLTFNSTTAWPTALPAEAGPGYALGELKAGETLTIEFNAIVQ